MSTTMANARSQVPVFDIDDGTDSELTSSSDQPYKTSYQTNGKGWTEVNRSLRQHGLPAVHVLSASHPCRSSGKAVYLDESTSDGLCETLLSLMVDGDHRQKLIHDLITRNDQLREDLSEELRQKERYQSKVKDLKVMLESSRNHVMELESERRVSSFLSTDGEKPGGSKPSGKSCCNRLQQACDRKDQEMEKLQRKLQKLGQEEEKRSLRQNQVFQEFKKRTARAHNALDEKLLDVIDAYEGQLDRLKKELDYYRDTDDTSIRTDMDMLSLRKSDLTDKTSQSFLKMCEKQLRDARKQCKNLEEQNEILKLEIEGRPQMKDFRLSQQRVKKLEKLLASHKISIPGEKRVSDPFRLKRKHSTHVDDLDYLPQENCHTYLKEICNELNVEDVKDVLPALQKQDLEEDQSKFENFAVEVHELVQSLSQLSSGRRRKRSASRRVDQLSEQTLDQDLSVIEQWRNDERQLPDLQDAIGRLSKKLSPWLRLSLSEDMPVSRLVAVLDRITDEESAEIRQGTDDGPSKKQLKNIVSHFQMLFEVPNISGVYPRMNDLYVKYGEVQNILHTLRNILGLSDDAKSTAIVDAVGKLCVSHNSNTSEQMRRLLQTNDLDSVIKRLEEHSLFFPIFQDVMHKLMDILGLERMDEVIPAVRALKLLAP